MVNYVPKKALFPAFGRADVKRRIAHVRADLPDPVRLFVRCHEIYHLNDPARFWLWREIKANFYAAAIFPGGFLQCLYMTFLSWPRNKFYIRRFVKGK